MSSLAFLRRLGCVTLVGLSACVIRLADRNTPLTNGGITGEPANCGAIQAEGRGGEAPAPAYRYVGRFVFLEKKDGNDQPWARSDWSGNEIIARFTGSEVSFAMGDHENDLLFQVILDGKIIDPPAIPGRERDPVYPAGWRLFTDRVVRNTDAEGRRTPVLYPVATGLDPNVPHEIILH